MQCPFIQKCILDFFNVHKETNIHLYYIIVNYSFDITRTRSGYKVPN